MTWTPCYGGVGRGHGLPLLSRFGLGVGGGRLGSGGGRDRSGGNRETFDSRGELIQPGA